MHFIHVNRSSGRVVVPNIDMESKRGPLIKKQVHFSQRHFSIILNFFFDLSIFVVNMRHLDTALNFARLFHKKHIVCKRAKLYAMSVVPFFFVSKTSSDQKIKNSNFHKILKFVRFIFPI